MTVSYQHGIKAQVSSRPAGTVDAILGFHPGNHHTGSAASTQLLGQPGHGKGIGPVLFKDHFTAQQRQLRCQQGQRAAWLNGRANGADMPSQKNPRTGTARLMQQGINGFQQLRAAPGAVRAVNKSNLHIKNQEGVHGCISLR